MHTIETRRQAVTLVRSGLRNAEVARLLDVPVGTISYWLHLDRARLGECPGRPGRLCPRCGGRPLHHAAYGYLLGLYLGDGHIVQYSAHRAPSLMVTCADAWPGIMGLAEEAMRAVFPHNRT